MARRLDLQTEEGWYLIHDLFQAPRSILIVTHKNPDGDAVGSALGLQWVLQKIGHKTQVAIPDDSPEFLKWLPGHQNIVVMERKSDQKMKQLFSAADLIICSDFNSPERLGPMETYLVHAEKPVFLVDHHPNGIPFSLISLIEPSKGSTSEVIYLMLKKLGLEEQIGVEAATCLLAGIMTDTVGLKVSCSYPEVFETVAALMRKGADKDRIYHEIYNAYSADRMRLLGYSLDKNMKVLPDFRTAYIALTNEEMKMYRHRKGDTEGFVNYPLAISGIVFSVLFTEQKDHIKLSLRSTGNFPANDFAQKYFLGGGHRNAAGGRFLGTMKEALTRFESVLTEYIELLTAQDR